MTKEQAAIDGVEEVGEKGRTDDVMFVEVGEQGEDQLAPAKVHGALPLSAVRACR